jgi:hypothetical protein
VDQETRQVMVNRIEKRGSIRAHRWWRIWPETPADMRGYGEGFRRPRCGSSGEQKGRGRGCLGLFIGTVRYRNGQELKELKRGGRVTVSGGNCHRRG